MIKEFQLEDDNIVEIHIKDVDGELAHKLILDAASPDVPVRFADLLKNIEKVASDVEARESELKEKFGTDEEFNYDRVIAVSRLHIESLENICHELEEVFGTDIIKNVYAKHFELDPDYVPDEYALMDLIEKLVPIINDVYHERFEVNKKKYNVNRRGGKGRHNLTKEELIQRQMGK
jgi:hypothetical protein